MVLSRNSTGKNIVLPDIPDQPHRPAATFIYLKREFGKKIIVRRSFQPSWFTNWPWLHYCKDSDVVFCHTCVSALRQKKMQLNRGNVFFVSKGFSNWGRLDSRTMKPLLLIRKRFRSLLYYQQLVQILAT